MFKPVHIPQWRRMAYARGCGLSLMIAASLLSGCTLTPDQADLTALGTAASQFKSLTSGGGPAAAARSDANKAHFIAFVARGQTPPTSGCTPPTAGEADFDAAVVKSDAATMAASWEALLKTPPCGWGLNLEPAAPNAPKPQPIIVALDDYYAGVAAIASASSVQNVVDATNKALAAASTLASLFPGAAVPAHAASILAGKLAQYSLQTAQFEALKAVLGDVDLLLDSASGPIISALRVQQGYWISQTSFFAVDGVTAIHDAFGASLASTDHIALLQLAQPILDDLALQQKAVRFDPGQTFHALTAAHHRLYAALKSNKGKIGDVLSAASDIAGAAQSMAGTATHS